MYFMTGYILFKFHGYSLKSSWYSILIQPLYNTAEKEAYSIVFVYMLFNI